MKSVRLKIWEIFLIFFAVLVQCRAIDNGPGFWTSRVTEKNLEYPEVREFLNKWDPLSTSLHRDILPLIQREKTVLWVYENDFPGKQEYTMTIITDDNTVIHLTVSHKLKKAFLLKSRSLLLPLSEKDLEPFIKYHSRYIYTVWDQPVDYVSYFRKNRLYRTFVTDKVQLPPMPKSDQTDFLLFRIHQISQDRRRIFLQKELLWDGRKDSLISGLIRFMRSQQWECANHDSKNR